MPIPALPASSTEVCIYFFPLFYLFNFLYRSKCQPWHCRRHQRRYIFFFFFFIYLISCIEVNANAGTAGAINAGIYIYFFFFFICLIPCLEVSINAGMYFFFLLFLFV